MQFAALSCLLLHVHRLQRLLTTAKNPHQRLAIMKRLLRSSCCKGANGGVRQKRASCEAAASCDVAAACGACCSGRSSVGSSSIGNADSLTVQISTCPKFARDLHPAPVDSSRCTSAERRLTDAVAEDRCPALALSLKHCIRKIAASCAALRAHPAQPAAGGLQDAVQGPVV